MAIYPFQKVMMMRDCMLSPAETRLVATQDGFEDVESFFAFFERYSKATLRDFEIIWWDTELILEEVETARCRCALEIMEVRDAK